MLMRRLVTAAAAALLAMGGLAPAAQAQTGDPSFNIVNRSGRVIYEAFASPTSDNSWGPDRLGQNVVPAGRNFVVRLPPGECMYDVRVVYDRQGGQAEERRNINLCNIRDVVFEGRGGAPGGQQQVQPGIPQGPQGNPSFHVVNQGQRSLMQVFASPTTDQNWGPDRLGADVVAPGAIFPVRLPEGPCMYDVRFVYDNGQADERRNVNLCEVINVTLPLR